MRVKSTDSSLIVLLLKRLEALIGLVSDCWCVHRWAYRVRVVGGVW